MINQQLIAYPQSTVQPLVYPTGEVIIDVYEDAPIPLVLVADDFTNTSDRAGGYSLSFDIPGTKKNNKFFNHIYTINSETDFDIHIKTSIVLKEGFINTFAGYLQLNSINNNIDGISYNITIYDSTINLKSALSERVFRDLDMTELTHNFDATNVEASWSTGLPLITPLPANSFAGTTGATSTQVVQYPMVKWNNECTFTSTNIHTPQLDFLFKPWVNLKYILQNILRDVGYTVDFDFLNPTDFNGLYVDFNKGWGVGAFIVQNTADVSYPVTSPMSLGKRYDGNIIENEIGIDGNLYYDLVADEYVSLGTSSVTFRMRAVIKSIASTTNTILCSIYHGLSGTQIAVTQLFNLSAGDTFNTNVTINYVIPGSWYYVKWVGDVNFTLDKETLLRIEVAPSIHTIQDTLIGYKGDTNQWEFVKDIINTFNLVIIPVNNRINHLSILPYNDWIDTGVKLDYTNKIDLTDVLFEPVSGLAKTTFFKFAEDDSDYITEAQNHPNDWRYSETVIQGVELFDNPENTVELSHIAATYCAPMFNNDVTIPQIMSANLEDKVWQNNMRLLYDNGVKSLSAGNNITSGSLSGIDMDVTEYKQFSSKNDAVNGLSYNYGVVAYDYAVPWIDSLYNTFWFRYMDELYHPETRILTVKAYLTAKDIYEIKFNDTVMIKNTNYRVIKISYNNSGLSEMELIIIKYL